MGPSGCPLKTIIGQVEDAQLLHRVVAPVLISNLGPSLTKLPALTNTPRMDQLSFSMLLTTLQTHSLYPPVEAATRSRTVKDGRTHPFSVKFYTQVCSRESIEHGCRS